MRDALCAACLLTLTFVRASQASTDECKKLVFEEYCLGGDIAALEREKEPAFRNAEGVTYTLAYPADQNMVFVTGFHGRIMYVTKMSTTTTWSDYLSFKMPLEEAHGPGEDESYFPDNANDPDSKAMAISLGRGQARHVWKKEGWVILLLWTHSRPMSLTYVDAELHNEYLSGHPDGS